MSAIKDVYDIIKEVKRLADEYQNQEMIEKVLEIQNSYFEFREELQNLKDENGNLQDTIKRMHDDEELEKDLELTSGGYYIRKTEREQGKNIKYCAACWQNYKKLMPLCSVPPRRWNCCNCHYELLAL